MSVKYTCDYNEHYPFEIVDGRQGSVYCTRCGMFLGTVEITYDIILDNNNDIKHLNE